MKLKKLLKKVPIQDVKGSKEVAITGICSHSSLVAPGNLFIAKRGLSSHGSQYIPDAIAGGAVAVLTDFYDPSLKKITQLIDPNPHRVEGKLAAEFYGHPSRDLFIVGITGTNGKTTTSTLAHSLFSLLGEPTGLIGTIEYIVGPARYPPTHTTPTAATNHKLFREMLNQGCSSCVMEVSSHALDQERCREIAFDVALFTNLSHDHLDYHGTMDAYFCAKKKLFDQLSKEGVAIVNSDSSYSEALLQDCSATTQTFGTSSDADYAASSIDCSLSGTNFSLHHDGKQHVVHSLLLGTNNVYNLLGAIAICHTRGYALPEIVEMIPNLSQIPGRLEFIPNPLGIELIVDFAHTPDALQTTLQTLQSIGPKRKIITVFGCGGDRDRKKRPLMGEVARKHSDLSVVTSDNPRRDPPLEIISEICGNLVPGKGLHVEPDRRKALLYALRQAQKGDIVLLAGKGHENVQIFASHSKAFDDRIVALQCCHELAAK